MGAIFYKEIQIMVKLSDHFTLEELVESDYAKKNNIENAFTIDNVHAIQELITELLEPFRQFYGKPIRVTSGFRCEALNKALGGVKTSAHLKAAADIQPIKMTDANWKEFVECMQRFINEKKPKFDEILTETSKTSKWIHVAYKSIKGLQRQKNFDLKV